MGYRIRYGQRRAAGRWVWAAAFAAALICCAVLLPQLTAGEGIYDAMARTVGGMIRSAR